jgi:hypothetical protein
MKNFLLLVFLSIVLTGCKSNSVDSNNTSGVIIKGTISASTLAKRTTAKSTASASLSDAKKVLVFSGSTYNLYNITNGSFTVTANSGTATALVFLDTNNTYIGNLCTGGLNVLPLVSLKNGENTTIDLSTLTMSGDSVTASHNPLGDEIGVTDADVTSLKEVSGYYESLAKNIDADNDGLPDILSKKQINISTIFGISVGKWGRNDTAASWTDTSNYYFNYMLCITGGTGLNFTSGNISLSGPAGDSYTDISLHGSTIITDDDKTGFLATFKRVTMAPAGAPWSSTALPFKKGTYTLTLDGSKSLTLDYCNLNMKNNLVFVIPTLHTNSSGKLTSITFEYKLPNGTTITPQNILTDIMVELADASHAQFFSTGRITNTANFASYTFSTPLDISTLYQIDLWYDDIIGNQYDIMWH